MNGLKCTDSISHFPDQVQWSNENLYDGGRWSVASTKVLLRTSAPTGTIFIVLLQEA